MKRRIKCFFVFAIVFLGVFIGRVHANSYATSFTTNASSTLKNGDIIEVNAGIACLAEDHSISRHKFTLIYDDNVFERYNYETTKKEFKVRDGWRDLGSAVSPGQIKVEVEVTDTQYFVTHELTGDNCADSTNATLVTFRLKVKNTNNQTTKVQVIDQNDYIKDLNFTIHNNSSNNNLSSLKVEGYELDETFNKNKTEYDVFVPYEVEKVNVTGTVEDNTAKISGTGEKKLEVGENKIELLVTAENGSKKTYVVNVTRKKANEDTSLSKVVVKDSNREQVSLSYDSKTKTYTGDVTADITFVSFDLKCSGLDCIVDELEPSSVNEGENEYTFSVVSQNGDKQEYKIIINKEAEKKDDKVFILLMALIFNTILCVVLFIMCLIYKRRH